MKIRCTCDLKLAFNLTMCFPARPCGFHQSRTARIWNRLRCVLFCDLVKLHNSEKTDTSENDLRSCEVGRAQLVVIIARVKPQNFGGGFSLQFGRVHTWFPS